MSHTVNGHGCDLCRKLINTTENISYFRCDWAECNYDVCTECGLENGGLDVPRPPQTIMCANNHYLQMMFTPWAYGHNGGSGLRLSCDLCTSIIDFDACTGYFRCRSRICDYDVCKSCGLNNGGIEIPVPPGNLLCNNYHRMSMLYAPEPYAIRGVRTLNCDLCRNRVSNM